MTPIEVAWVASLFVFIMTFTLTMKALNWLIDRATRGRHTQ